MVKAPNSKIWHFELDAFLGKSRALFSFLNSQVTTIMRLKVRPSYLRHILVLKHDFYGRTTYLWVRWTEKETFMVKAPNSNLTHSYSINVTGHIWLFLLNCLDFLAKNLTNKTKQNNTSFKIGYIINLWIH